MTLETFFEKFELFADAPDAVAKMRELVLELAVSGRLMPEILERSIENETKPMGSIVELVMGQAPSGDECNAEKRGTVFVKVGEFGLLYPREEVWTTNPLKFAKKGDVLVCVVGATVGKLNLGIDCAIGRSVAAIRPSQALDTQFLYYSLIPYTIRLRRNSRGSAQGVIGKTELNAVSLWVPSRSVQQRIVAKVDELMALCDRLEAQQQEREQQGRALARASLARFADAPTPANLDFLFHPSYAIPPADLRKSILTLAVQGKLVPFDNDGEEQKVGDHIEFQNGYAFKSEWLKPSGMRLCRNANVSHGLLDWRESAFVNDKVAKEFERFALSEGDIVLSLDRPLITTGLKVARVKKADLPCLLLQRVAKPVPKHDQLNLSYFLLWLNSSEFVDSIDPGRSNGVPHISTRQVQRLPFVLPPLAEQRRIVAKVDELMALVDALETQLATVRTAAANLLSAAVADLTTA